MQVYLAGKISGLDYCKASTWRKKATSLLEKREIAVLDPLRGKLFNHADTAEYSASEIVDRDLADVKKADVLLVRHSTGQMTGTVCEMMFAKMQHKPIVVFGVGKKTGVWLEYLATKCLLTLEEAVDYIASYLGE